MTTYDTAAPSPADEEQRLDDLYAYEIQAVDNLIGNAVKDAPGGDVVVRVRSRGPVAVLEVADTGVGIPEDELDLLFDRYFRASTSVGIDGTGIGLSVVKTVIDAHSGTIAVQSTVGHGTTFRIELPA